MWVGFLYTVVFCVSHRYTRGHKKGSLASDLMVRKRKVYGLAQVLEMKQSCYLENELKWPKEKLKPLWLWISTNPELSASLNNSEKLEKVKGILR